jgi:aspartyl protease family protein
MRSYKISKLHHIASAIMLTFALPLAHAADVNIIGVFGGKATLVIDGGRPRTLSVGESTPEGIKLVSTSGESAVVEIAGKRQTVSLGQRISTGNSGGSGQRSVLTADARGHFVTTAAVNGVSIPFMVDTGATSVTISSDDAKRAGVNYTAGQRAMMQTANGAMVAWIVKFDTVRLGEIALNNVDGIVIEGNRLGSHGLLGMSFLNRTEMKREGDTMSIMRRF